MNNIHIYYHQDLDGMFSAILYGKLLTDSGFTKVKYSLSSVNYHLSTWQDIDIRKQNAAIVIVDFMYNPFANVFYDHHQSGLGRYKLEDITTPGRFDDTAPSCAQVIFDQPGRSAFKDEEVIKKILKDVNMVDYALYPDVETVYSGNSFGPKMRIALLEDPSDELYNEIIRMGIYDGTFFYRLLEGQLPWSIEWRYYKSKAKIEQGYEAFKKVARITENVVHYTDVPYHRTDRYFSYRLFPQADYAVYIRDFRWMGQGIHIGLSKNPWKEKKTVNLKEVAEKFGGGGHQDVAGILVTEGLERGQEIQQELVALLLQSSLL